MSEKIDFDMILVKWFRFKNFDEYHEFMTHFLLHATLSFFFMSFWWPMFIASLGGGIAKEVINDGNLKHWNRDAKLDMLARCLGSVLPLITLIWR